MADGIVVKDLNAWFGAQHVVKHVSMEVPRNAVTAVIGPSGCGKSTFIRCLNRMHETVRGARVTGAVLLDGEDLYAAGVDPVTVRRRIGMVFQRSNPFPTMSVFENVAAGLMLNGVRDRTLLRERVEQGLRQAALWDEVKDDLGKRGLKLSGGQQQRLCIARALAVVPQVLLMDEPCSALDPIASARIEELILALSKELTVVVVTHRMSQARRVSGWTAYFLLGELIEFRPTRELFTRPGDRRTEDYITGRFD